jgi:hypothetical protein
MPNLYEALAEAFLAEGVDTQFVLLGDGNMHWSEALMGSAMMRATISVGPPAGAPTIIEIGRLG